MPPDQTPPPQPESFNFFETELNKNFAPWFIKFCIVLIIIGLAIAGYFKYQAYQNYKYGLSVIEQSQEKAVTTPSEVEGWQTYRNDQFGFGFKYPADWRQGFSPDHGSINLLPKNNSEVSINISIFDSDFVKKMNASDSENLVRRCGYDGRHHIIECTNHATASGISYDRVIEAGIPAVREVVESGLPPKEQEVFEDPLLRVLRADLVASNGSLIEFNMTLVGADGNRIQYAQEATLIFDKILSTFIFTK
ncbi:MAG: hypothetical protein Q7S49_01595 [bacterium]|nr:hypothetical protein [bacterium]